MSSTLKEEKLRLSIVTASFNRVGYLADAMESVLSQGYPNLEYVVVDGGSTDGGAEVVRRYAPRLSWWVSESDEGQYHAINKGFAHTTGDLMAWLNSDDKYLPWTFSIVSEIFAALPEVEWLTTCFPLTWDRAGRAVSCGFRPGVSRGSFLRGEQLPGGAWYAPGFVQQESTFWRRSLWERCGARLDTHYRLAADFDLWMRFSLHAELHSVATPLGGYRSHGDQITGKHFAAYLEEARRSLESHGGRPAGRLLSMKQKLVQSRVPGRLRRWGSREGLLERRPLCVYGGPERGWYVDEVLTGSGE
jgi:hypothetical protein